MHNNYYYTKSGHTAYYDSSWGMLLVNFELSQGASAKSKCMIK